MLNVTIVRNALYNLTALSGADCSYCKGMIVGIIAGLGATGLSYEEIIRIVQNSLPAGFRDDCIPLSFRADLIGRLKGFYCL